MAERDESFYKDPANLKNIPQNLSVDSRFQGHDLNDFYPPGVENISDFLVHGKETSNQLRTLGEAFEIWKETLADDKNVIYLGLSGDMVTAGMAPVVCTMIEEGYIDGIFSQGANLFHDTATTLGYRRRQTSPQKYADTDLFSQGAVRMYDTLEATEPQVFTPLMMAHLAKELTANGPVVLNTRQLYYHIGRFLVENGLQRVPGILTTAYRRNMPIWVAGAESSVLMMDLAAAVNKGGFPIEVGITKDLIDHATVQERLENAGYRTSLVEIGGGVVRNTLQQVATMSYLIKGDLWSMEEPEWFAKHRNAILITTDTGMPYGGASSVPMVEHNPHHPHHNQGENLSWGKFDPSGKRTTVYLDATVALPLLVMGLLQNREVREIVRHRKALKFTGLAQDTLQLVK
jgi:deoxyhypusine synthase